MIGTGQGDAAGNGSGSSVSRRRIGVMFDRSRPPEELAGFARAVEAAGAEDLWVVEDLRWAGSFAQAATALAATGRLRVGIGISPAPLRNPALLARRQAPSPGCIRGGSFRGSDTARRNGCARWGRSCRTGSPCSRKA